MRNTSLLRGGLRGRMSVGIMHPGIALCFVALLLPDLVAASPRLPLTVASPDGAVVVRFSVRPDGGRQVPAYSVAYRGKPILLDSSLGLTLENAGRFGEGFDVEDIQEDSHSRSWKPLYGERSTIPENYREALVSLKGPGGRRLQIVIRAYNEGAALRYVLPDQPALKDFVITSENTEFHIPDGTRAWETHGTQQTYENVWTKDIEPNCDRPLVIEYPDGRYAALLEAGARNYPVMLFSPAPGKPGTLVSTLRGGRVQGTEPDPGGETPPPNERASKPYVWGSTPFATPWRAVIVGERPGDLMERNYLVLNLNEPSAIMDTSWIKPGKCIRDITNSTRGAKECVDFAKKHDLQYVVHDGGWYGSELDPAADATVANPIQNASDRVPGYWYGSELDPAADATVANPNPNASDRVPGYEGLDLPEVLRYAKESGIGIMLYVDHRQLERQMDEIAPLYEKWGVKGIKFGFVQFWSQHWTKWIYDSVETAAKHRLMVDIHDEFRPTGLSRTYPNLMTQEGIAGNEGLPTADHNTVLPFTRFLAGPADYTIGYYDNSIKTTRAHQLALAVVYYSPLQFLYWGDHPSAYKGEPEIEFFDKVPTVWDDTKVLDGQIGRYITVARRSGSDWFVGTICNGLVPPWYASKISWPITHRVVKVPLRFLPQGRSFIAHIYENGNPPRTDVKVSTRRVDASTVIEADLPIGGGQAIWIEAQR